MPALTGIRLPWANRAFVERLASIGVELTDPEDVRLAKSVVTAGATDLLLRPLCLQVNGRGPGLGG